MENTFMIYRRNHGQSLFGSVHFYVVCLYLFVSIFICIYIYLYLYLCFDFMGKEVLYRFIPLVFQTFIHSKCVHGGSGYALQRLPVIV